MRSFRMKARTISEDSWQEFTLHDVPVRYDSEHFALVKKDNSPLLLLKTIVRCSDVNGLAEGDIVESDEGRFLICYERGFYAISADYLIVYLNKLHNVKVVGDYWKDGFPVKLAIRERQLFKYHNMPFKLIDIIGQSKDKILIRACKQPLEISECQQECGMSYNGKKVYLGDLIDNSPVDLHNGRLCILKDSKYFDIAKECFV